MPPIAQVVAPCRGQVFVPQSPVVQITSHEQALAQLIDPHAFVPVQVTVHAVPPVPHVMLPHAPSPVQMISHAMPLGQATVLPVPPVTSIMHVGGCVPRSHEVQVVGHVAPASTQ